LDIPIVFKGCFVDQFLAKGGEMKTYSQMTFDFLKDNVGEKRAKKAVLRAQRKKKIIKEERKFTTELVSDKPNPH
jgi:hypothetical protein